MFVWLLLFSFLFEFWVRMGFHCMNMSLVLTIDDVMKLVNFLSDFLICSAVDDD